MPEGVRLLLSVYCQLSDCSCTCMHSDASPCCVRRANLGLHSPIERATPMRPEPAPLLSETHTMTRQRVPHPTAPQFEGPLRVGVALCVCVRYLRVGAPPPSLRRCRCYCLCLRVRVATTRGAVFDRSGPGAPLLPPPLPLLLLPMSRSQARLPTLRRALHTRATVP